jgi:hypothetical protein
VHRASGAWQMGTSIMFIIPSAIVLRLHCTETSMHVDRCTPVVASAVLLVGVAVGICGITAAFLS